MNNICAAPVYTMKELNNIFIELTLQNCNQKCKNCYIKFPAGKTKNKDFISVDRIKEILCDTKEDNLECIYLTGGEPMTHPDFNAILRMCLKRCDVCICTNGSFLNEKKIRFLSKVEAESSNRLLFKLTLCHYNEADNDIERYRGNYRQTVFALKTLCRYNFNSVLCIQNCYKLDNSEIIENINALFEKNEIYNTDIQIISSYPDFCEENYTIPSQVTDCMHGRTVTTDGIYTCPFLADDYRGRCGSNFKDYSKTVTAESEFCATCSKNNSYMFTIG